MKKSTISDGILTIRRMAIKRSPEILTGIGIAGMVTTTIMAVQVTPKALDLMAEVKETHKDELDNKQVMGKAIVMQVAPVYIPSILVGGVSIACLIGASSVNARRNAALAAAYTLSEATLKEYQEKVIETIGEKKEQSVRDAIAKDRIDKNPVSNNEVIITPVGNTLCYDAISGRYFTSDIEKLKRIENEFNRRLLSEMYLGLNEMYYELGLRCTQQGNELGWNIDDGLIEFQYSAQLADDGRPCLVVSYRVGPRYGYGDLH